MFMPTLSITGFKLAYKTWGENHLPPLLALHGWLDNANSFNLLAPYLANKFYVIALDLPGHGYSTHLPVGHHYHFIDGIFIIAEAIEALGYKQISLLGHSMGACLASLVAGTLPEKITSLLLIEGLGPFTSPEMTCQEQLARYAKHINKIKNAKPYPSFTAAAQARAEQGYLSIENAEILCMRGIENKQNAFYWRHDRRLLTPSPLHLTENQVLSCLQKISARSCLIWANQGFMFEKDIIVRRVKAVKSIKEYYFEGGHHIHMEKPHLIADCLDTFYSQNQIV